MHVTPQGVSVPAEEVDAVLAAMTKSPGVMVLDDVADPGPPGPEDVSAWPRSLDLWGDFFTCTR